MRTPSEKTKREKDLKSVIVETKRLWRRHHLSYDQARYVAKKDKRMTFQTFPILMYHRIEDSAYMHQAGLRLSGEHCSLERFRSHVEQLSREYQVLQLTEIVDRLFDGEVLPENAAAITFDDGTRDHIEVALPLLVEFGLSSTFFLMSGPLLGRIPPTFKMQLITGGEVPIDEVAKYFFPEVLNRVAPAFASQYQDVVYVPPERYIGEEFEEVRQMKYLFNYLLPPELKERVADELFADLFGDSESDIIHKMFLSADDVRLMIDSGMTVGCHTQSHYNLSTIDDEEMVNEEIITSKEKIALATGYTPQLFAYPAGGKEGYTPGIVRLVSQHYRAAFITGNQKDWCSARDDLFELPRIHEQYFDA